MYVKPNGLLSSSEKFMSGSWIQMGDTQMIWQINLLFFIIIIFFLTEINGQELHIQRHLRFNNQN